jgi:hypothetical protein
LSIAGLLISNFGFLSSYAVDEQNEHFKSSYSKMTVDSENPFTVQTERHLYKPGDDIKIEGIIWSGLIIELGGVNQVTVQILGDKDNVLNTTKTQVNSDGQYDAELTLPDNAGQGAYTMDGKINVSEDVLNSMTLKTQASIQSSSKFVVAKPNPFSINADGKNFIVIMASNSEVSNLQFDEQAKKLTFTVSGETGTNGVTDITIPKSLLNGNMNVMIDGQIMSQDDVIEASDTQDETTLEINYHHSTHIIEVVGTNAVPEFPFSIMVMSVAISLLLVFVSIRQRLLKALYEL